VLPHDACSSCPTVNGRADAWGSLLNIFDNSKRLPFCWKNTENRVLRIFRLRRDEVAGILRRLHGDELYNFALQSILLGDIYMKEAEVDQTFSTHGRDWKLIQFLIGK
jgi:hypothetical protein